MRRRTLADAHADSEGDRALARRNSRSPRPGGPAAVSGLARKITETPYYTDKPDWDAFEALLLFGACRIYDMPVPEQFPKHGQFEQFAAAGRMQADENMNWSLFTGAVWWLPLEECFVFRAPLPTGDEAVLGTAGTLLAELKRINELSWQADEKEICAWSRTEGYPGEAEVGQGGVLTKQSMPGAHAL